MPKPLHKAWGGYVRVIELGPDNKPVKGAKATARCKICNATKYKVSEEALSKHTKLCLERHEEERKAAEDFGDAANTPSSSSVDVDVSNNAVGLNSDGNNSSGPSTPASPQQHSSLHSLQSQDDLSLPSTSEDTSEQLEFVPQSVRRSIKRRRKSELSSDSGNANLSSMDDDEGSHDSMSSDFAGRATSTPRKTPKKVKKSVIQRKPNRELVNFDVTEDDKAISVYKYYLVSGINFENIQLPATSELFRNLDPHFILPTLQELRTTVADKAADKVYQLTHSKNHTQVLQLLTRVVPGKIDDGAGNLTDWNKIQVLTLLRSSKGDWTFVKSRAFLADPAADHTPEVKQFCNDSVTEAKSTYDVEVLFLLHDGEYALERVCSVEMADGEKIQYYTICDILSTIKNLHCDLVCNLENHTQVNSFYNTLKNVIPTEIRDNNPPMATAIQRLFESTALLDDVNQSVVSTTLSEILNPLHLAVKILHPEYHKTYIDEDVHRSLLSLYLDFQQHEAPRLLSDSLHYYLDKTGGCFTRLYRDGREKDPVNFWNAAKLDPYLVNVKLLANYALQLLSIPSTLAKFDLKEAFLKLDKHPVRSSDFENVLFTYLLE